MICAFKDAFLFVAIIKMLIQFEPVCSCSKWFRWEGLIGLDKSMTEYLSFRFIFAHFIGAFIKMHILSAPLKMPFFSAPLQRCSFSLRLYVVALNHLDGKGWLDWIWEYDRIFGRRNWIIDKPLDACSLNLIYLMYSIYLSNYIFT